MKQSLSFIFLLLFQSFVVWGFGQSKVALEQIQIYSSINPNASYWHLPDDMSAIVNALDTGLFPILNLQRDSLYTTRKKELTKQNQLGKISIDWSMSRNIPYHAYLELYELDPDIAFQNKLVEVNELKKDSIHSIWIITCTVLNSKQERVFQKTLIVGLLPVQTLGMGYPITTAATTPNNIFQAIVKGIGFLHPSMANMDFLEAKVPMAYAADNYWMPIIHNQQRRLFDTTKQFINFASTSGLQILRIPSAVLNKIELKNKDENYPFRNMIARIKKTSANYFTSEFYQVIQPLRDVQKNKDYTLQAYLEFNPEIPTQSQYTKPALVFLPEISHTIFDGRDSIGKFAVRYWVTEKNKFYYPDQIYNGYDSSKTYALGTNFNPQAIVHSSVIEGNVLNHSFEIQFDLVQQLKTILVDNKIVMIVKGDKKPSQMVNLSTNQDDVINNLLLLIAYSEIFQSPN